MWSKSNLEVRLAPTQSTVHERFPNRGGAEFTKDVASGITAIIPLD